MLQIDDQVLALPYGTSEDEPLDRSRAQQITQFYRRGKIVWGKAILPDGQQVRGQSPLGEIQHAFQRDGYAKDNARVLVERDLGVSPEALFSGEHLPGSTAIGLRQKDGWGSN